MRDTDDQLEPDDEAEWVYPTSVTIAGIVWIVFGGIILVNVLVLLLMPRWQREAAMIGGASARFFRDLFGAAFIYVGVQSVRGTARDTLGNGIGSIVFGLLKLVWGGLQASDGENIQAGIGFLAGAALIAAGVLALIGRSKYKAWRRAEKAWRESAESSD